MFRLKARDRFEAQRFRAVKCVADGEIAGVRQADNIAGQRLVNDQPFGAKEFIRVATGGGLCRIGHGWRSYRVRRHRK